MKAYFLTSLTKRPRVHFSSATQCYKFPNQTQTNFTETFIMDPSAVFIDKTAYAASMMVQKEKLIFFGRPRRFGKSTFIMLLDYLYTNGLDDQNLINKFPNLKIFDSSFLKQNPEIVAFQKKMKTQTFIPINLDFVRYTNDAMNGVFDQSLRDGILQCIQNSIKRFPKEEPIAKFLSEFVESHLKKNSSWSQILTKLEPVHEFKAKLVFLIDEYESPIMSMMNNPNDPLLLKLEAQYKSFFSTIKSLAKLPMFEKSIMTGVISIKHLDIFSGMYAFDNMTLDPPYQKTFGFTKSELLESPNSAEAIQQILEKWTSSCENSFHFHKSKLPLPSLLLRTTQL